MVTVELDYFQAIQLIAAGETRIAIFAEHLDHGVTGVEYAVRETSSAVRALRAACDLDEDGALTHGRAVSPQPQRPVSGPAPRPASAPPGLDGAGILVGRWAENELRLAHGDR